MEQKRAEEAAYRDELASFRRKIKHIDPNAKIDTRFYTPQEWALYSVVGINPDGYPNRSKGSRSSSYNTGNTHSH